MPTELNKGVSIVVPVYRGEQTLRPLAARIEQAALSASSVAFTDETVLGDIRVTVEHRMEPLDDGQVAARGGDILQLSLQWRADQTPQGNYTVFVQLLDDSGQVVAQRDRWPGDGLFPTAALQAGQVISDNLAIALDLPPGRYRLITGLYQGDVEGYPRLAGPGGDYVELSAIQVQP